ncbi:LamG-like jellyroll fold domain-containing protein [Caldithrix abyssi]
MKLSKVLQLLLVLGLASGLLTGLQAQTEDWTKPYTVDEHTILLMHFDGDLTNESPMSGDGIGYGTITYIDNTDVPALGQAAYLKNDARSDSSYIIVPDTITLRLDGSWTIEGWVNFLTIGESSDDWHWRPMLLCKEWNYAMETVYLGFLRFFGPFYRSEFPDDELIRIEGTWGVIEPGVTYHWAFIRDADHHYIASIIHNKDGELVDFKVFPYDPDVPQPRASDTAPLKIGTSVMGGGFIDGIIDEYRISDVVRKFDIPPIIAWVNWEENQHAAPGQDIIVLADIVNYASAITSATVYYSTGGDFAPIGMTLDGDYYKATIPGQPLGTQIRYYIEAQNSSGFTSSTLQSFVRDSAYYGIAVWEEKSKVLDLEFENGSGLPYDSSQYHQTVNFYGNPQYSTDDPAFGQYAMYFEGDTSFLRIDQPAAFMNSDEMTIDFWFKAEELRSGPSLFMKQPEYHWDDWQFSYRLWMIDYGDGVTLFPEIYIQTPNGTDQKWTRVWASGYKVLEPMKWYHVIYKISSLNNIAICSLFDQKDSLLYEEGVTINGHPKPREGEFTIGSDYVWNIKFKGWIDRFEVFNYAMGLPPAILNVHQKEVLNVLPNTTVTVGLDAKNAAHVYVHYMVENDTTTVEMTKTSEFSYEAAIPGLDFGQYLRYYFTAVNENGDQVMDPADGIPYVIAYTKEHSLTLGLDFEEGSGVPVDASEYANEIIVHGKPEYSTDAKEGSYAISLEGDSSYLEIPAPAPFLASNQISIELWFKAESMPAFATDLLGKFPVRGNDWAFGPRLWFQDNGKLFPEVYIVSDDGSPDQAWTHLPLDTLIQVGRWYRVIMEVGEDTAYAQLYNADNELIDQGGAHVNGHLNPVSGKFTIGRSQFDDMPYFHGKIDGIKIYNYPIHLLTAIDGQKGQQLPTAFELSQNYPNPFNPSTEIRFALPEVSDVQLEVFNLLGQKVKTLFNGRANPGTYRVSWNGTNESGRAVASGVYLYRLKAGKVQKFKKMILLR